MLLWICFPNNWVLPVGTLTDCWVSLWNCTGAAWVVSRVCRWGPCRVHYASPQDCGGGCFKHHIYSSTARGAERKLRRMDMIFLGRSSKLSFFSLRSGILLHCNEVYVSQAVCWNMHPDCQMAGEEVKVKDLHWTSNKRRRLALRFLKCKHN